MAATGSFNDCAAGQVAEPDFAGLAARLGVENYSASDYSLAELETLFPGNFSRDLLKDWAFKGFRQRMPGRVGIFHALQGMDAQNRAAARTFLDTLPPLARLAP